MAAKEKDERHTAPRRNASIATRLAACSEFVGIEALRSRSPCGSSDLLEQAM
jgi:hypothetical protein